MQHKSFSVTEDFSGIRIDSVLSKVLGLSRTFVAELLKNKSVNVNGKLVSKSTKLVVNDWVEIFWQEPKVLAVESCKVSGFSIIYEETDFVVVDKPSGVAAHPALGWSGPTVLGALLDAGVNIETSGDSERQGIVQRLDVGTSGLMVVAKTEYGYEKLKKAFHDREVKKIYYTLVQGVPNPSYGTIEAPIGRHPNSEWKFAVTAGGKSAITHYETVKVYSYASLLRVILETGRTHQIRVHMSASNHPCVGDKIYGADPKLSEQLKLDRQWLHAAELSFVHPVTGVEVHYFSSYASDLQNSLNILETL